MTPYEFFTICLSFLAFALSLYSALNTYYEKHIKTQIYLRWTYYYEHRLVISLMLSNMSSRPSSLTNVLLHYGNNCKESSLYHLNLTVVSNKMSWSDITPINIPARSATNVLICFNNLDEFKYQETIDISYIIDGLEIRRIEKLNNKLGPVEFVAALNYRAHSNA